MQRHLLPASIVDTVRSLDPPGRFLRQNTATGFWDDIGNQRATEKTAQALREGAPQLRKRLKDLLSTSCDQKPRTNEAVEVGEAFHPNHKNAGRTLAFPSRALQLAHTHNVHPLRFRQHHLLPGEEKVDGQSYVGQQLPIQRDLTNFVQGELTIQPRKARVSTHLIVCILTYLLVWSRHRLGVTLLNTNVCNQYH